MNYEYSALAINNPWMVPAGWPFSEPPMS